MTRRRLGFDPWVFWASGFGLGFMSFAPGTWGSLLAVALRLAEWKTPWGMQAAVAGLAVLLGIPLTGRAARRLGGGDPPQVVWDETAALLAATVGVPLKPWPLAGLFVAFRLFDIVKPWPIRLVDEKVHGGIGIMADDLVAAGFALAVVSGVRYFLRV